MDEYLARIVWRRGDEDFLSNRFSRAHTWEFDGGAIVEASPSPHVVPAPMSVAANVDPEEAFVAALSSCHMLFFLAIAAKRKFTVDEYVDEAVGILDRNEAGRMAMTRVTLRPRITFAADRQPTDEEFALMHEQSHRQCFIANSVTSEIAVEPVSPAAAA